VAYYTVNFTFTLYYLLLVHHYYIILYYIFIYLLSPADASTDRKGTLGIGPRAGTNFALGPLSDRIPISGGLVVNGQYIQCTTHKKFTK